LERDVKGAATLLIDCIATFACNEICSYQSFILYAIMSNLLDLKRPQIKEKLLDGPEVLSVANDIPEVVGDIQAVAIGDR
jgi:26S proteasome regulatory subunit N7